MNQVQIDQYNIRYEIENYLCPHGKRAIGMAHRISKNKMNYKKYDKGIIDHNFNLVPYHNLECNDSFNIGMNPNKCEKLVKIINCWGEEDQITVKEITRFINE